MMFYIYTCEAKKTSICAFAHVFSITLQYLYVYRYLACCLLEQSEGSLSEVQLETGVKLEGRNFFTGLEDLKEHYQLNSIGPLLY